MAEDQQQNTDGTGQQQPGGTQTSDRGFPENTPLAEMNPEQQAAYWKQQARKHESTVKEFGKRYGDYESLKERASQYDALLATTQTDQERAVTQARKEAAEAARAEAQREFGGQLVAARLQSALAGRLADEQIESLLEGVDPTRFLTDAGSVDAEKVTKWADRVAPKRSADLGQGQRGAHGRPLDMNALIRKQAGVTT